MKSIPCRGGACLRRCGGQPKTGRTAVRPYIWQTRNHLLLFLSAWFLFFLTTIVALATDYYVDFEAGNNVNAGTSPATAWKHAPGDANASGNPASVSLQPGDRVLFKGDVKYRGQVRNVFNGTQAAPIVYKGDGWPGLTSAKAIVDGTDPYSGDWTVCSSANDCGGNPHWQNIYYSDFSGEISPFTQFFENNERVYIAQTPNMSDPFWDDRYSEYLPVTPSNITLTSITDPAFFTQGNSQYWDGAYIQIWVVPNVIAIRRVSGFNPATNTLHFESLDEGALYGDRNQYYSLVNHLHALDGAGEYVIDETAKRIYYWPLGEISGMELSLSSRANGISTRGRSHLVIEGFIFHGFTSDTYARAIMDDWVSERGRGLVVRSNEIRWTRSRNGRRGSIEISYTNGVTIHDNWIHHCQRNSGILVGTDDIVIRDNRIQKIGYKGIWFMGVHVARVLRNLIEDCSGTHGNPVSIFTSGNVLVAHNRLYGDSEVLTFERDGNLVIHNNIIHSRLENGQEVGSFVLRENGDNGTGYHIITNNTILNSATNFALGVGVHPADPAKLIIRNNIADGGGDYLGNTISHNLYTGLSWRQRNQNWHLSEGEKIEEDLSRIFAQALQEDLRLLSDSAARNAGIDLVPLLPMEIRNQFADFDFSVDIDGNRRGIDGYWDSGAYEYIAQGASLALTSPNGSEVWRKGAQQTITWTAQGISETLTIEILQGATVMGTVAQGVNAAAGTFSWTVGRLANGQFVSGSNLKIRIRTASGAVSALMRF